MISDKGGGKRGRGMWVGDELTPGEAKQRQGCVDADCGKRKKTGGKKTIKCIRQGV